MTMEEKDALERGQERLPQILSFEEKQARGLDSIFDRPQTAASTPAVPKARRTRSDAGKPRVKPQDAPAEAVAQGGALTVEKVEQIRKLTESAFQAKRDAELAIEQAELQVRVLNNYLDSLTRPSPQTDK